MTKQWYHTHFFFKTKYLIGAAKILALVHSFVALVTRHFPPPLLRLATLDYTINLVEINTPCFDIDHSDRSGTKNSFICLTIKRSTYNITLVLIIII